MKYQGDHTREYGVVQSTPLVDSGSVELKFSCDGCADSGRWFAGWCLLLMDVVENFLDHVRLSNRTNDT